MEGLFPKIDEEAKLVGSLTDPRFQTEFAAA